MLQTHRQVVPKFETDPCYGFRVLNARPDKSAGEFTISPTYLVGVFPITCEVEDAETGHRGRLLVSEATWYAFEKPTRVRIAVTHASTLVAYDVEVGTQPHDAVLSGREQTALSGLGGTTANVVVVGGYDAVGSYIYPVEAIADANGNRGLRVAKWTIKLYDSGLVAGDAAIDSGILDLRAYDFARVKVFNGNATNTRQLSMTDYDDDGITAIGGTYWPATATAAGANDIVGLAAAPGKSNPYGMPGFARLRVEPAGAGVPNSSRLTIWVR